MIEAFLQDHLGSGVEGRRILDIGTGNGQIAHYFSARNEVYSVDVVDQRRVVTDKVKFQLISSEALPFEDAFFDIVVSHHVIEHVEDQTLHMSEIRRVLKKDGVCYLGTPNKSSPFMAGHKGNDQVLRYEEMAPLFENNGFRVTEVYVRLLKEPGKYHCETGLGRYIPAWLLDKLKVIYPSQCFLLQPGADG